MPAAPRITCTRVPRKLFLTVLLEGGGDSCASTSFPSSPGCREEEGFIPNSAVSFPVHLQRLLHNPRSCSAPRLPSILAGVGKVIRESPTLVAVSNTSAPSQVEVFLFGGHMPLASQKQPIGKPVSRGNGRSRVQFGPGLT